MNNILSSLLTSRTETYRKPISRNNAINSTPFTPTAKNVIRIPGKNCIYSGGGPNGQNTYVEYTEDSTENDPIVRISGHSSSGDYDKTVHVNDINPDNATYPELCALLSHMSEIGSYDPGPGLLLPTPLDVECGDYSQRQNFTQKIRNSVNFNRDHGNNDMASSGQQLLDNYKNILDKHKQSMSNRNNDTLLDYAGHTRVNQKK